MKVEPKVGIMRASNNADAWKRKTRVLRVIYERLMRTKMETLTIGLLRVLM